MWNFTKLPRHGTAANPSVRRDGHDEANSSRSCFANAPHNTDTKCLDGEKFWARLSDVFTSVASKPPLPLNARNRNNSTVYWQRLHVKVCLHRPDARMLRGPDTRTESPSSYLRLMFLFPRLSLKLQRFKVAWLWRLLALSWACTRYKTFYVDTVTIGWFLNC